MLSPREIPRQTTLTVVRGRPLLPAGLFPGPARGPAGGGRGRGRGSHGGTTGRRTGGQRLWGPKWGPLWKSPRRNHSPPDAGTGSRTRETPVPQMSRAWRRPPRPKGRGRGHRREASEASGVSGLPTSSFRFLFLFGGASSFSSFLFKDRVARKGERTPAVVHLSCRQVLGSLEPSQLQFASF